MPRAQTMSPKRRSVCPLMPPTKVTEPRSGRAREASPPPWWALWPLANAVAGATTANAERAASMSTASTVRPLRLISNIVSPRFEFRFSGGGWPPDEAGASSPEQGKVTQEQRFIPDARGPCRLERAGRSRWARRPREVRASLPAESPHQPRLDLGVLYGSIRKQHRPVGDRDRLRRSGKRVGVQKLRGEIAS